MKVLLWAPFGAGTHYWGPGTSAFRLYKSNKDDNVEVTLVHGSNQQGSFPGVYKKQIQLGNLESKSPLSIVLYLVRSIIWILKNRRKYDVFHGLTAYFYSFMPALFFYGKKRLTYIKITGVSGGFTNSGRISGLTGFSKLRKKKANSLSGYISVSSDISKSLVQEGVDENRIFYIPNGVDTDRFCPVDFTERTLIRSRKGIKDIFTICYVGGLTENKRVLSTVKATHDLVQKGYDVQFLIVGPDRSGGLVESEISRYISENSLQSVCIRIKHTSEPEVYFQASDVFVLNSEFEGLSNSLLEAMSCGLPCVASPASGTVDLIEDGITGYLTNGSSAEIAAKVGLLYGNQSLYREMSKNVRHNIVQQFSVNFVWNQHLKLFKGEIL